MWRPYHPRTPWIQVHLLPRGAIVKDTRTGEQQQVSTELELQRFAAAHSTTQGYRGLGDAVAGVTQRMGLQDCTPCAKRQAALNRLAPRLFRR